MNKNEEIFEWVIEEENELLKLVRINLKEKAFQKYGNDGVSVVDKYYRQIDGEEDVEDPVIDEDCDDCKEKAKKILEVSNVLRVITDILMDDTISNVIKKLNIGSLENALNSLIKIVQDKTCFIIDKNMSDKIQIGILLEKTRRLIENECK